jgi:hypothetical protein
MQLAGAYTSDGPFVQKNERLKYTNIHQSIRRPIIYFTGLLTAFNSAVQRGTREPARKSRDRIKFVTAKESGHPP